MTERLNWTDIFLYSGYSSPIRYMICKYLHPFCGLPFYSVVQFFKSLWSSIFLFFPVIHVSVKIFSIFFSSPVIPFIIVSNLWSNTYWVLNVSYCIFHLITFTDFISLIKFYIKCFHEHIDPQYFRVKRTEYLGVSLHLLSVTSLVGTHSFLDANMPGKFLI